jgi:hypothetical protein
LGFLKNALMQAMAFKDNKANRIIWLIALTARKSMQHPCLKKPKATLQIKLPLNFFGYFFPHAKLVYLSPYEKMFGAFFSLHGMLGVAGAKSLRCGHR